MPKPSATTDHSNELLVAEPVTLTDIRIGYARVSTGGQKLERQIDALTRAGCRRIFAEKKSGRNTERPELEAALAFMRPGDTLVVPALDRLSRSLQDLITTVADLRGRGVGFTSLHENLDTTTPGGRLVFHVFAALAEFIRELIVVGTHEGLAAARARGRVGGRPTVVNADLIAAARDLLPNPAHSITSIAKLLGVSPGTLYNHIPDLRELRAQPGAEGGVRQLTGKQEAQATNAQPSNRQPQTGRHLSCPGCGAVPSGKVAATRLREELQTEWWSTTSTAPDRIQVTRHCGRCQPHTVYALACLACGDGPLLTGQLAELAQDTDLAELPDVVTSELVRAGWRWTTTPHATGWVCCQPTGHETEEQR